MNQARHNVLILSIGQALSFTGLAALMTVSMLAGKMLADDPALSTIPLALQLTATMFVAIPASLIMAKVGRRIGFILGQFIGIAGGILGVYAIAYAQSFSMLCVASLLIGTHNAFWQFFRFAAVDVSDNAFRPRAIAYVLTGGIVAALLGPEIAKLSIDLFTPYLFAGTYLAVAILAAVTAFVLIFLNIPKPPRYISFSGGRPLLEIIRQPQCLIALISAMAGYGLMMLVMTATPLSMIVCGFEFNDAAFIIQWHTFFMFAPGFFTGQLIKRYGIMLISRP
ncbi:MAG: MFS transporter [Rhodospirillales bacterium]|jgi:MFS family permease|nr:MFS transporter [Rhodospirillales bacterium]